MTYINKSKLQKEITEKISNFLLCTPSNVVTQELYILHENKPSFSIEIEKNFKGFVPVSITIELTRLYIDENTKKGKEIQYYYGGVMQDMCISSNNEAIEDVVKMLVDGMMKTIKKEYNNIDSEIEEKQKRKAELEIIIKDFNNN